IIPFDHDVVVESHPPDNPINAEHARQVDSCARSQDPTDLAGSVAAVETVETAETAETDGSVLRFTSESCVEATGSEDQETRSPKKYSYKKVSDERTDFPAHKPIIKITIKIPIKGSNACPFMNARPLHHQKKHGRRIF